MNNSIHRINDGDAVTGTYLGVPYAGIVTSHRPHSMNWKIEIFFVTLAQPIAVMDRVADALVIHASDDLAAASRFSGGHADTIRHAE